MTVVGRLCDSDGSGAVYLSLWMQSRGWQSFLSHCDDDDDKPDPLSACDAYELVGEAQTRKPATTSDAARNRGILPSPGMGSVVPAGPSFLELVFFKTSDIFDQATKQTHDTKPATTPLRIVSCGFGVLVKKTVIFQRF